MVIITEADDWDPAAGKMPKADDISKCDKNNEIIDNMLIKEIWEFKKYDNLRNMTMITRRNPENVKKQIDRSFP